MKLKIAAITEKNQIDWISTYNKLRKWILQEGKFPYQKSKDKEESSLGEFINKQRYRKENPSMKMPFSEKEKAIFELFSGEEPFESREDALTRFKPNPVDKNEVVNLLDSETFTKIFRDREPELSFEDWFKIIKDFREKTADNPHYPKESENIIKYGPENKSRKEKQIAEFLRRITINNEDTVLTFRGKEINASSEQIKLIKEIKDLSLFSEKTLQKWMEGFKQFYEENNRNYPSSFSDKPDWPNKKTYGGLTEYQLYNWVKRIKNSKPKIEKELNKKFPMPDKDKQKSGKSLFSKFMEKPEVIERFLRDTYEGLISYNGKLSGCDLYKTDNKTSISKNTKKELTELEKSELREAKELSFYDVKCCHLNRCYRSQPSQLELEKIIKDLSSEGIGTEKLKYEIIKINYEIIENTKIKLEIETSKKKTSEEIVFDELLKGIRDSNKENIIYFLTHLSPFSRDIETEAIKTRRLLQPKTKTETINQPLCSKTKEMIYTFLENKFSKFPEKLEKIKEIIWFKPVPKVAKLRISRSTSKK